MGSYAKTWADQYDFQPEVAHNLPLAIDDMSLAFHLGIHNKTLWWCILGGDLTTEYRKKTKDATVYGNERLYKVFQIPKSDGRKRDIQNPVIRLKNVQRALLVSFLNHIPLGDHVGAYVPGRSCAETAKKHIGKGLIISLDIRDFFPSVKQSMIRKVFQKMGYNRNVASLISGLVVYRNFLPQGAPTSGFIANLVADHLFDRQIIEALQKLDPRWVYTRYSDDIDVSHPEMQLRETIEKIIELVKVKANAAGFKLNTKKTKVEPYWHRQQVLGMVVNKKLSVPRAEYARLRCLIHNCTVHGFESQFARADQKSVAALYLHIAGKLNYFSQVDREKGEKLAKLYQLAVEIHKPENTVNEVDFGTDDDAN